MAGGNLSNGETGTAAPDQDLGVVKSVRLSWLSRRNPFHSYNSRASEPIFDCKAVNP
jgi:hypothetical protein